MPNSEESLTRYARRNVKHELDIWTERKDGEQFVNSSIANLCSLILRLCDEIDRRFERAEWAEAKLVKLRKMLEGVTRTRY